MSANDDPRTLGRTRLSFANEPEIDEFVSTLGKFETGELGPDQWRTYRLVRGTYGQRQTDDASMVRCKIPQGVLSAAQLYALARVADDHSRGFAHITTRQNMQFHFVKLRDVPEAMRVFAEAGLTTREACGNSVRNITCCPYAGVAQDEPFDTTPYAEALTRYLLRHRLTSSMPRKFKIALEGCGEDHANTAINDLGFRARLLGRNGTTRRGFRVTVGGGTAILCTNGSVLHDFLPASELFNCAEAVIRIFHRLGDREHRQRNRIKFLIKHLGWTGFLSEYERSLAEVRSEGGGRLPFDPEHPPVEEAPSWPKPAAPSVEEVRTRALSAQVRGPGITPPVAEPRATPPDGFAHWMRTNVRAQRQTGYSWVVATVPMGDLTSQQMRVLGDLARAYSDGSARVTPEQNLLFRWVKNHDVLDLHRRLEAIGLGSADANTLADVTSCPGAESCRLAVTQSRGLGKLLTDLLRDRPDLVAAAPDVRIKISGCPNGCGLHHVAGIGFQGSIRKVGSRVVPQYFVMLGGGISEEGARFGKIAAKVPARRIPAVVERLIRLYTEERRQGESAAGFFARLELARAKELLKDLEEMTPATAQPEDYVDLGETHEFKPETMEGECAA